jgi:hypothetical protein
MRMLFTEKEHDSRRLKLFHHFSFVSSAAQKASRTSKVCLKNYNFLYLNVHPKIMSLGKQLCKGWSGWSLMDFRTLQKLMLVLKQKIHMVQTQKRTEEKILKSLDKF